MTFREEIAQLYVATFNRAADADGLNYWENNSGLTIEGIAQSFFDQEETQNKYPTELSLDVFVNAIYLNLFGRTAETAGLEYWVNELETGSISKGNMILAITNGALDDDAVILDNKTEVCMAFADAGLNDDNFSVSQITTNPNTVQDALNDINKQVAYIPADNVFTLKKVVDETITITTDDVTTAYWGDPDCDDCNITVDQFYEMIRIVTGQDIFELWDGGIDIDAETALTDVVIIAQDNDWDEDPEGDVALEFTTATGEQFTAELALAQTHYALLDSLIYYTDSEGNKVSRFTTKTEETTTETSTFDLAPIMLTPDLNNGGTYETGNTTDENDLIVAGQVELVHGAYIDGGAGINTLEVDMKGVYAQPLQLLNIQNVIVHNLPNVYTDYYDLTDDAHRDGYNIPDYLDEDTAQSSVDTAEAVQEAAALAYGDLVDELLDASEALSELLGDNESNDNGNDDENDVAGAEHVAALRAAVEGLTEAVEAAAATLAQANAAVSSANVVLLKSQNLVNTDSILDLSRAIDLDNLFITEGNNTGNNQDLGELVVVGVRNNATLTLEGYFSEDVTVHYGQGMGNGVDLVMNNVVMDNDGAELVVVHNSPTLNIHSTGGGNALQGETNFGYGVLTQLNISGDARLSIEDDLYWSFADGFDVEIDASANTAGVELYLDDPEVVNFIGSQGDDRFVVETGDRSVGELFETDDTEVNITDTAGNNHYEVDAYTVNINSGDGNNDFEVFGDTVTIIAGDGNNQYEIDVHDLGGDSGWLEAQDASLTIIAGNGNNHIDDEYDNSVYGDATITFGDGDNTIDYLWVAEIATITLGDGNNTVTVEADQKAIVTAGNGDNKIDVSYTPVSVVTTGYGDDTIIASDSNTSVTIDAGDGENDIQVCAENISINSGEGDDKITLSGGSYEGDLAMVNVDAGAGHNTILLADNEGDDGFNSAFMAKAGSSIKATGGTIDLIVNSYAELHFAALENIEKVILSNENNRADNDPVQLKITAEQFIAIGAENFSVQNAGFGENAELILVVSESMNFNELGIDADTFDCNNINLRIEIACLDTEEVTFSLSAEQLHKYIAVDGISVDSKNDYDNDQVIVTDAGYNFDAFGQSDEHETVPGVSAGQGGGTIVGTGPNGVGSEDVTVIRTDGGYERPSEDDFSDSITINSDETPVVDDITSPFTETLKIEGSQDIAFTGDIDLGKNFTVDFSELDGAINNMTITEFQDITDAAHFSDWGQIIGNDNTDNRINIEVRNHSTTGDTAFGVTNGGFQSSGVQTYVVTELLGRDGSVLSQAMGGEAAIVVCDSTEDLEVLGLQNNRNTTVTFEQVNWGTEILMEGDGYANASDQEKNLGNPDISEIGTVVANFFEAGANAVVNITNQGTALGMNSDAEDGYDPTGVRVLDIAGIELNNADRLNVNVQDGDAVIHAISGEDIEIMIYDSENNLTVQNEYVSFGDYLDVADLRIVDASAVDGVFTYELTNSHYSYNHDLSGAAISGLDQIIFNAEGTGLVMMTLSVDQTLAVLAEEGISTVSGTNNSWMNFTGLAEQEIDLSAIDIDNVHMVSTADVDGTIVLNENTNLGAADVVVIVAEESDTTLQMSADQYHQICYTTASEEAVTIGCRSSEENEATLKLTDLANDESINLQYVDQTGAPIDNPDVVIVIDGITATEDMEIINGTVHTLEVSGENDLTLLNSTTAGTPATIEDVNFTADGSLTLTADQVIAIEDAYKLANPTATDSAFSLDGATNVTLNVIDLDDTQPLNLDLIQAAGINIGTVSIADGNAAITIDPATTFGDADEIITPTADENDAVDGIEPTQVTMTVTQFLSTAGVITGDSPISLTGLVNNVDTDSDYTADEAEYDFSGIANAYQIFLGENVVTLTETADLGGFEIMLDDGQLIRFATEAQAAADITVYDTDGDSVTSPTGVQWMWTDFVAEVDTAGYDGDLTTLFIDEALLVSQPVEEDLWSSLDGNIVVEKINGDTIPQLVQFNRTNTFEALTNITGGVNYDDSDEFSTVANLTMNLEGEVNIASVLVGDTLNGNGSTPGIDGEGYLNSLTINSYLDTSNIEGYNPTATNGINLVKNTIGDISLNAGSVDDLVNITINTYSDADNAFDSELGVPNLTPGQDRIDALTGDMSTSDDGFYDFENVNGLEAERDGMAIEIGTISIEASDATVTMGTITLEGSEDITIEGIDMSDPEITLVEVINDNSGTVTIDNVEYAANLTIIDGFVAPAAPAPQYVFNAGELVVAGGDNDLTEADTSALTSVSFTGNAELTMTAAQVAAIGTADVDGDGVADAWAELAGASGTLHIVDLTTADTVGLDLNAIEASGINIGTVSTLVDASVTLDDTMTLGGADEFVVTLANADALLTLQAAQFEQISGNIVENDTDATVVNVAHVTVTDLDGIATDTDGDTVVDTAEIDLTTVLTTGEHRLELADAGTVADLTITAASELSDFTVVLDSIGGNGAAQLNNLDGQTVRFSTQDQASRAIDVTNDNGANDNGTNVVWLFNTVTGKVDTANYDGIHDGTPGDSLGRVWMLESLVDGQNVEELYTHLNASIIIRVVNEADLDALLAMTTGFDRHIEIESFTTLTSLTFSDVDNAGEPFDFVENLTVDLGGDVVMTDITVDNILAAPIGNDDEFNTLTINSFLADDGSGVADYLLPEDYDNTVHTAPSNANQIGDIKGDNDGGTHDFDLGKVVINTGTAGAGGNGLIANEIFFSDDGDGLDFTANPTVAELVVTGDSNVTVKSLDTSDADITGLVQDLTGYSGTLLVTGGSPAVDGGGAVGNTETLEIQTDGGGSTSYFGYAYDAVTDTYSLHDNGAGVPYAGVSGLISSDPLDHPASITVRGTGTVNLGVITDIDSENFLVDVKKDAAFVTLTMGEADANGVVDPELSATGTWTFLQVDELTITEDVVFNTGGQLTISDSDIIIDGEVDFTPLEGNFDFGTSTIYVAAGNTLTVDVAQLIATANMVDIQGEGTLIVTGDASGLSPDTTLDTTHIRVANVNLAALVVDSDSDSDTDSDDALAFTLDILGSIDDAGDPAGFNVIGSDASDTVIGSSEDDTFTMGAGDDTIIDKWPNQLSDDTFNVDQGTDTITNITTDLGELDVLVVSSGATANVTVDNNFVASADTVNNGTANLTLVDFGGGSAEIDMSLASGPNGYNIMGDSVDGTQNTLTGSEFADIINGGNDNQDSADDVDTLTGNGGDDVFEFNISMGDNTTFTQETTQIAIDREEVQITTAPTGAGTLTVNYTVNGGSLSVLVDVLATDTVNDVASNIAAKLQADGPEVGSAIVDPGNLDTVILTAETGKDIEFTSVATGTTGTGIAFAEGVDQAQIVELTSANNPTDGDIYTAIVSLNASGDETGTASASGDTADTIITDIATAYGTPGTVDAADTAVGDNMISFEDQDADNGGFALSVDTTAAFGGSGASEDGAADYLTADVITDFVSADDSINFVDLAAGSGTNFLAEAGVADYAAALSNAQAAFTANTGSLMYYVTSAADLDGTAGTGLVNGQEGAAALFFDANLDGTVDGVVLLTGVDENDISALDIIA